MRGKRYIGVAALGLVLSAGLMVPANAAKSTHEQVAYSSRGLIATAEVMTEQGGYLYVQGMEDGQQITRVPGTKPVTEAMNGVVAFTVEVADPDILAREVWCIAENDEDFTMDRDLTTASFVFSCEATVVDVICTETDEDGCAAVEEVINDELSGDVVSVDVQWTGVGGLMRDLNMSKSDGDSYWWFSHGRYVHRDAVATGTIVSESMGTIFDGEFDYADLANVRDRSIQRGEMPY